VEGCCEHGTEPSGSITCWVFREWLSNCWLAIQDSTPWTLLVTLLGYDAVFQVIVPFIVIVLRTSNPTQFLLLCGLFFATMMMMMMMMMMIKNYVNINLSEVLTRCMHL
jgi:hypothetical protein